METDDAARLDKWLWTARFFKTRSLAAAAIDGGKIEVNDEKPKRARTIRPGDRIRIRLGAFEHRVTVRAVARQRGSAAVAAGLFEEDADGKAARERLAEQHRLAARATGEPLKGRPTKKARRDMERWGKD
jgi:ribosome-associated heat shock protein Hsp15